MKILVGQHDLQIDKKDKVNQNEYKITKCEFEFDEAITDDLVKIALFTNSAGTYKEYIVNNECDIPAEILAKQETTTLGVYAYKVEQVEENEETSEILKLRYSPEEIKFFISNGSYKANATNTEPITPTDKEQMEQAIQDMETKVDNLDIDAEKVEKTTTITITKKDGTEKEVEILDGEDGTSLESIEIKNRDLYVTYGGSESDLGQVAPNIQVGTTTTITLPDTCDYYYVGIALGFTGTEIFKVQVEKRDTNTAYQPYTLQTYPINLGNIELCKIGTYQDYIRKSSGKNLFEYEYILVPNDNNKNAHLKQGTYTISTESGNNFGTNIYFKLFDSNGNAITKSGHLTSSNAQINFSTSSYNYYGGSGSSYIIFTIDNDYTLTIGQLNADGTKRVMLNEGNTVLPYEPYGTSWYLNKQIGKVVLDGSESTWGLSGNNRGFTLTGANEKFTSRNTNVYDGFCNYFNVNKNSTTWASTNYCGWNTINTFWIREDGQIASTVADFKIWLSTHNVLVYYVLATPTYEEITDAKLISQLETIKSVNGQTNISQENNDLPFILDVVALKGI